MPKSAWNIFQISPDESILGKLQKNIRWGKSGVELPLAFQMRKEISYQIRMYENNNGEDYIALGLLPQFKVLKNMITSLNEGNGNLKGIISIQL